MQRHKAHRLAIFNHKGGVGKTTLTVNIAWALVEAGKRVLLVDSDPQCNLTSYLVENNVVNDLLDTSDKDNGRTIWSALKPLVEGEGKVKYIKPNERVNNLFLLPGDIKLIDFEMELNSYWIDCFQRKVRGFKGVTALSTLVNEIAEKYDINYIFYDCGPNIGPLNKTLILDSDYFIIPAACDLFSLSAIKTLGHTLINWLQDAHTIFKLAPDNMPHLPGEPNFLGYIPQRFRTYGGQPTYQYSKFLSQIEKVIESEIVNRLRKIDDNIVPSRQLSLKLGEIREFLGIANSSQEIGASMWDSRVVGTVKIKDQAHEAFRKISEKIMERISQKLKK